jgi:DNA repair protein RecO (recombination protein O)
MNAIVLSRKNFRENDQLVSLFTLEHGIIKAVAPGVKKILSKNASHLEPCSLINVDVLPGREISKIITAIPINIFIGLRADFFKSMMAQYSAKIIEILLQENEKDEGAFNLFNDFLIFLSNIKNVHIVVFDSFAMKLISLIGFLPQLESCVECESDRDLEVFGFAEGGALCRSCMSKKIISRENCVQCSSGQFKNLTALLHGDFDMANHLNLAESEYKVIHKIIYNFIQFCADKKLPDWAKITYKDT